MFVTQSETSTGVRQRHPGAERGRARRTARSSCVDAVSGLGAVDLPQDEWGVDVVVSGSQKSLMCPPGLAFASVSERALALAAENPGRPLLPRLGAHGRRASASSRRTRPFTPAVTLFRALDVALDLIFEEGLERAFARHALLARAARAGIEAIGLERFGPDDENANVVTVARLPDDDRRRQGAEADARPLRGHRSPAARAT